MVGRPHVNSRRAQAESVCNDTPLTLVHSRTIISAVP